MPGLKFNEPLSWRAGKAIPVADLLTRLEKLGRELQSLPQEETDRKTLKGVSQELAHGHLLGHRDKGVRAWTACCLVEIFRLCAPDAPFTQPQLTEIFTLFVTSIIPALADPSNAYNTQHVYAVNSLAEVKSIILLTDLHNPEALLLALFSHSFDIVSGSAKSSSGEEVAANVKFDLTSLLVTVVEEAQSLATAVIDVIIAQFLRVDPRVAESRAVKGKKNEAGTDEKQGTLIPRDYSPAYNMSKTICDSCTDKMAQYISGYFNDVIVDASEGLNGAPKHKPHRRASFDDSDDEGLSGPSGEDLKEISKAHRLVRELWRACPDVLQNVIPQVDAELSAESASLRTIATETIGDVAAGIGIAGPPPPPPMDPAAYPTATLQTSQPSYAQLSVLLTPISPKSFSQTHPTAYASFLSRRHDKSAAVRSAWTTAVGRILITSSGGIGLSEEEEQRLMKALAEMLGDADEHVRSRAVKAVGQFSFSEIILRVGASGGVSTADSVLSVLSERVKDRKHSVREEAMTCLGRIWGVASGELEANTEQVVSIVGDAPTKIFDAYYTNDPDTHSLINSVLFELLLPLSFPPIKSKSAKAVNGNSQVVKDSQAVEDPAKLDVDELRVRRILTLLRRLDESSRKVFYAIQGRQVSLSKYVGALLQQCELYNGGVMDSDEAEIKARLTKLIDALAKMLPDPPKASSDLWTFAKKHDRRSYQLIRFCMAADSDYQTIYKAIKELTKRVQSSSAPGLLDTLTPLLYRSSLLVYNKSHIPAIMRLSKDDNNEIASTAHELLTEISSRTPEVLKAHVNAICRDLETEAPTLKKEDGPGVEDTLKACSGFAKKFPAEIPKDRKFLAAMNNFALYSNSPRAAKHAVSILMSVADKKEAYAKDLIQKCTKDWKYGTPHFLARLSTLAQLNLLAPDQAEEESDAIVHIAIYEILLKSRTPSPDDGYEWSETVDEETTAKELALKMLVNRIRSMESDDGIKEQLDAVVRILTRLITGEGELLKSKDSPAAQKSRLRLLAANLTLKICSMRRSVDELWTPQNFNSIAFVAQDSLIEVRTSFITKLKKYLGQSKLGNRWYTIPFLLAYEPFANLKDTTLTWLRARALFFSRPARGQHSTVMESVFARLLSVLAHHPDYSHDTPSDLVDFTRYILFYLSAVANERNLSLIFHVAQRVKQCQDAVSHDAESKEEVNENLYHLSDLAQATIRIFEGYHDNWTPMQTWPGKVKLPNALFAPLPSHDIAQEIAEKNYLPDEADEMIEKIVKSTMRKTSTHTVARKRKIEGGGDATPAKKTKKAKTEKVEKEKALPIRKVGKNKTPKPKAKKGEGDQDNVPSSERRKSGRATGGKSYKEEDSDEDDAEMEEWNEEDEAEDEEDAEAEEESEDAQAGKEDSPDIDVDVDVDDAEGEAEEEVPVQTNGKKTPNRPGKGKGKTSASSPAAIKENRKPPTPAPKGRRTRAAAAAGSDEMED